MSVLPFSLDISLSTGCDLVVTATVLSPSLAQLGLVGATAQIEGRITPEDPAALFTVSTTSSASGSIALGVAFPGLAGLPVSNANGLQAVSAGSTLLTSLPQTSGTVANLSALATLPTSSFVIGSVVFVTADPGTYYAWSPADPSTPNGSTIVAGISGNWLLAGTVTITISAASAQAMLGYERGIYALVVTFADGQKAPLFAGKLIVTQNPTQ